MNSDPIDAHCPACHAATPASGDAVIARALTVQASKLYAVLHYSAEAQTAREQHHR